MPRRRDGGDPRPRHAKLGALAREGAAPRKRLSEADRLALLARIAEASDPLVVYKPGPTQRAFRHDPTLYKALGGPNRSGKTLELCAELTLLLEGKHPLVRSQAPCRYILMVPSRRQAGEVWGEYLVNDCGLSLPQGRRGFMLPEDYEMHWDRTIRPPVLRRAIHRRTGHSLFLVIANAANAQNMLEGMKFDGALIDESAGTQALMDEVMSRLLDSLSNPEKEGTGFIWWGFTETKVNAAATEFLRKCRSPDYEDYKEFRINPSENPRISVEARKRVGKGLSEAARKVRMDGTAGAADLVLIFPRLAEHRDRWVLPHPYEPLADDNIYVGFDPGIDHPCALVFAHLSRLDPSRMVVTHVVLRSGEGPREVVAHIADYLKGRRLTGLAFDQHGGKRREWGTGKSAIQHLADLMSAPSWWQGGMLNMIPPLGSHKHGIVAMQRRLDEGQDLGPRVVFDTPTAENGMGLLLDQLCSYRGREDKNFTGPHGVVKKNDDAVDAFRYLCVIDPHWADLGHNAAGVEYTEKKAAPAPWRRPAAAGGSFDERRRSRIKRQRSGAKASSFRL